MLSRGGSQGGRALSLLVPTLHGSPAPQTIHLPWARTTLCPGLPLTGPFVSLATLSGLCPDTLFYPQPSSAGPCPVPVRTLPAFPALLTAPRPRPLRAAPLPWAQLLPPKPRGHSQLKASHWFTQVPPLWQVLLSHTFFLAGQPRVERRALRWRLPTENLWQWLEGAPRPATCRGPRSRHTPPLCIGPLASPLRQLPYRARCHCWQ